MPWCWWWAPRRSIKWSWTDARLRPSCSFSPQPLSSQWVCQSHSLPDSCKCCWLTTRSCPLLETQRVLQSPTLQSTSLTNRGWRQAQQPQTAVSGRKLYKRFQGHAPGHFCARAVLFAQRSRQIHRASMNSSRNPKSWELCVSPSISAFSNRPWLLRAQAESWWRNWAAKRTPRRSRKQAAFRFWKYFPVWPLWTSPLSCQWPLSRTKFG